MWNVAHQYAKTATFMPKPTVGDTRFRLCTCICRSLKTAKTCSPGDEYAASV
ncbi:hypothetical protein AB2762_04345 [Acinetobacter indicus]